MVGVSQLCSRLSFSFVPFHNGMIIAKQGRTTEELGTISGALTLLPNIVMAWNTHHLQAMIDRRPVIIPTRW